MLNIVIPVLNEEKILQEHWAYYRVLCEQVPVVFVDGGSDDSTLNLIKQLDAHLIHSRMGRSFQKNAGAAFVHTRYLLFLHIDSFINKSAIAAVKSLIDKNCPAACFQLKIDDDRLIYRIYEAIVNLRAKSFGVLDGDLGLLISTKLFNEIGGFDELPVMEDVLIGKKIKKMSKVKIVDRPVYVSARKWRQNGFLRTFFNYAWAYVRLWSGTLRIGHV